MFNSSVLNSARYLCFFLLCHSCTSQVLAFPLAHSSDSMQCNLSQDDSLLLHKDSLQPLKGEKESMPEAITLDTLIVPGTRKTQLLKTAQTLTIIKADEWEGTTMSIADIIATHTGVQSRRYGGVGSFQTLSIRGVHASEIIVYLDGIPLNSAMAGAVDLGALNPDRIAEIHVYKGNIPGEFGGNAIGGVVHLISKTAFNDHTFNIQTAMGAYGFQKYRIETNQSFQDRVKTFCSLGYTRSSNDWRYLDRNKTPYNTFDDVMKTLENHRYHSFDVRIHPSFSLNKNQKVSLGIGFCRSIVGIPASEGSINKTAKHEQELFDVTSVLSHDTAPDTKTVFMQPKFGYYTWSSTTSWTDLDESMATSLNTKPLSPNSWAKMKSDLHIVHGSTTNKLLFSRYLYSQFFLQGKHSFINTQTHRTSFPAGDWPGSATEALISAELSGYIPLTQEQLKATVALTVQAIRSATKGGKNDLLGTIIPPRDTIEYPFSAHSSVQFNLNDSITFFGTAGRCSSVPGLREKYGTNGPILPNPALKQETGISLEVGCRNIQENWWFEFVFFRTESKNGIVMLSDGTMTKPVNCAHGLTHGTEASCWIQPHPICKSKVQFTLQRAENRSRLYNYFKKRLPNEPDLSVVAQIALGPFHCIEPEYQLMYKSPLFRDYGNTQRVPLETNRIGLFFHSGRIMYKSRTGITSSLSMRNIIGTTLGYEHIVKSVESGYSWILYPSNEWCISVQYSF